MDVKVTSTGKLFYQIDNATAALLMEMFPAAIERVTARPAPTPAALIPTWGINVTQSGYHYVVFSIGERTDMYDGPPSRLVSHFQQMGVVVPDQIVTRYKPLWRPRDNEHPAVYAEYEAIHSKEKK